MHYLHVILYGDHNLLKTKHYLVIVNTKIVMCLIFM